MRLLTAEALVLETSDFQERDRLVTFLSREHGRKRGVAQGARRRFSRFGGILQPLAKVSITWFEKEGRDLVRIRDAELVRPAGFLLEDLEGILLASYLADHAAAFAQENEPAERLSRLLDAALEALAAGADRDTVARYVEAWILRLEGIFPPPRECPRCGQSLVSVGAALAGDADLICRECARSDPSALPVSPEAVAFLLRIARGSPAEIAAAPPPLAIRRELEALHGRVRRHFLGHELKSYTMMRETLGRFESG
jgi:DNA repair protein RecO (recombination protein O)